MLQSEIKQVGYIDGSFYVSLVLLNDFHEVLISNKAGLIFIGSPGWFAYEENREIYSNLDNLYDLSSFYPGEYITIG